MRVAAPVDGLDLLGPEPQHHVLARAGDGHGEEPAREVAERLGRGEDLGEPVGRVDGPLGRGLELGALAEPVGQPVERGLGRDGARRPPAVGVEHGDAASVEARQQRRLALDEPAEVAVRGSPEQVVVMAVKPGPVLEVAPLLGRLELERGHLGEQLAGRADGPRKGRRRVVVAGNQAPEAAVVPDRQRERRRDPHVAEVLGVHHRRGAERAVRHRERLAGVGVGQRDHLGHLALGRLGVGERPDPDALEHLARGLGDVVGRVPEPEPRREVVAARLGEHLAREVGVEPVDHHPVEPGRLADLVGGHLAERPQRRRRLEPPDGALDQAVVVGHAGPVAPGRLELDQEHAVDRVRGEVEGGVGMVRLDGEDVEGVAVQRLGVEEGPEPPGRLPPDHVGEGPVQERLGGLAEERPGVAARLRDREVRRADRQERAVGLDAPRRLDRFGVAVGDGRPVAFDAVHPGVRRGRAGGVLYTAGGGLHEGLTWGEGGSVERAESGVRRSAAPGGTPCPLGRRSGVGT